MKGFRKLLSIALGLLLLCIMSACGDSGFPLDYGDEVAFEADLNAGKNLEGKTVSIIVGELHPQSAFGYNIWAGEHLNFISEKNPDVEVGETIIVQATSIRSNLGSWLIEYKKVNATADEHTIYTESAQAFQSAEALSELKPKSDSKSEQLEPLDLVDYGWYIERPYSADVVYMNFCGMVYNPNRSVSAVFPEVIATIANPDGTVIATDSQMGMKVMPLDTVTLVGMMSVPTQQLTEETTIEFQVSWSDFSSASQDKTPKTTDFEIKNVSEQSGSQNFITGTITNHTEETVDSVNLSLVLRKDGKIVFAENTFMDYLRPETVAAFQFQRFSEWPEHDSVEVSAQAW